MRAQRHEATRRAAPYGTTMRSEDGPTPDRRPTPAPLPTAGSQLSTQVVAVDHLGLVGIAQQRLDLRRGLRAMRRASAPSSWPGRARSRGPAASRTAITSPREVALHLGHADGQQALAVVAQLGAAPASTTTRRAAAGGRPSTACAPPAWPCRRPARADGLAGGQAQQHVGLAPQAITVLAPLPAARLAASTLVSMPPGRCR
jgi:hypothetical protein